jgi:hypothetical protein
MRNEVKQDQIIAKAIFFTIGTLLCFQNIQAQLNWRKGGNSILGGNIPIIGTDASWNSPLRFHTFGTQHMIIRNISGFVGIGTGFSNPNNLLDVNGGDIDVNTSNRSYMIADQSILWHKGIITDIFVGVGANGLPGSGGSQNTVMGNNAGFNNVGINNVYLGYRAGFPCTGGVSNTFLGSNSGGNNAPGADENVFVGWQTGMNNIGVHNTFAGNNSGANNSGSDCSFFGIGSGLNNGNFQNNCYFGASSGSTGAGDNNVFMGAGSGPLGVGSNNVAIGFSSAFSQNTGMNNTYLGYQTALAVTSGTANTFLGGNANSAIASITNAAVVGANAVVVNNDQMILGNNKVNVGIGLSGLPGGPANKLEINVNNIATATSPNATSPPSFGASGLRFTKMTTLTPTITNPGSGVLTVDNNGDVIYVSAPSGTGCCLGSYCGTPPNPLTGAYQIPLNANTFNFTSLATTFGSRVNIGFTACGGGVGRLNVQTDIHRFAGTFINNNGFVAGFQCVGVGGQATSTSTNAIGVKGDAVNAPAGNSAIGVEGQSDNSATTASENVGVHGFAANGITESVGGFFQIIPGSSPSGTNVGVRGNVDVNNNPNAWNIGGAFTSTLGTVSTGNKSFGAVGGINTGANTTVAGITALPLGIQVGLYGYNPSPQFTPPSFTNQWAGYFDGNVKVNGSGQITNALWVLSDKRFKDNFKKLDNVLEKINKLNGYSYTFKTEEFKEKNFESGAHYGLIAQELKEVFPELVQLDSKGYYSVCYEGIIPVLLEAIKSQQKQIDDKTGVNADIQKQFDDQKRINDEMQSKMNSLEQLINSCCSSGSSGAKPLNSQGVNLSDKNVIVLNQNVPNPFAESTVITYNIPTDFTKAQINFSTTDGKIIKSVDITVKGPGSLNVFANDLTNGFYSYTLIVDGKVIDTKKMVKD